MCKMITANSKTFLIGEYCVLFGGGAIVITTPPEFKLTVKKNEESRIIGINEKSPAFSFYTKHKSIFKDLSIEFIDPHSESGGFGASSAQFTMLYKLFLSLMHCDLKIKSFLEEYKYFAGKASGADCISQIYNHHVIHFNSENNLVTNLEWNFDAIDFLIFKTGFKTSTHIHLSQLNENLDISELNIHVENAKLSFVKKDNANLISSVNSFFSSLKKFGFVLENTSELVKSFINIDGVFAAKGCGAMCSDAILVIFDANNKSNVIEEAKKLKLTLI